MKKLLIIEDDPITAHIYRTRLEKEGYAVEVATDGHSGYYRIHEYRPSAVLLDLMLPKLNGVDVLKKICAQAQSQRVPVIVFTNAYMPNMIQEAFAAGATQVFNKATLTPRQIIDALAHTLNPAEPASTPQTATFQRAPDAPGQASLATSTAFKTSVAEPSRDASSDTPENPIPPALQPVPAFLSPPAPEVPAPTTPVVAPTDEQFQAELLHAFLDSVPESLSAIRKALQEFSKAQDDHARREPLLELFRRVHAVTGNAGIAGLHPISRMAAALEVLLKELYEKPKNLNASTLRTVANSIDFIGELFTKAVDPRWHDPDPVNILVVDDEILSRRAITYALEKAGLKSVSIEDPHVALTLAAETPFSLIFLDVQMPGMDGFDLCTRIRMLPANKATPVVFVTSLTDFKSRARSTLSGGTDLIAKPFMFIELSVKALTYVLRSQLAKYVGQRRAA
ncbi:MAG: response regulator [Verrucomicrobia bacterium]|nr:response regulator [Verrucomicrobiota bacterium]